MSRQRRARQRAANARRAMRRCRLCAHDCRVDRTAGPAGRCRAAADARIFHEGIEWAGEAELVPTYVVSFAGCNFTCDFCLTGPQSQSAGAGQATERTAVAARIRAARSQITSMTILGGEPSVHLPSALDLIAVLPDDLPIVWKTNGYASPFGLVLLAGLVDVVLADFKFGNDACALRLAGIPRYLEVLTQNLRWATRHTRLVLRHLLMPGHRECCTLPVLDRLAATWPEVPLSLMTGYLPAFRAAGQAELGRSNRLDEIQRVERDCVARRLRRAPWSVISTGSDDKRTDQLLIDRAGRILVDSASAPLVRCLERIAESG